MRKPALRRRDLNRTWMRFSPDFRQALGIAVGAWALSSLIALAPRLLLRDSAFPMPLTFLGSIVGLVLVPATILSLGLYAVARRARGRSAGVRLAMMAAATVAATLLLSLADAVVVQFHAGLVGGDLRAPTFMRSFALNLSDFAWPFATLSAIYIVIEVNKLARERELAIVAAKDALTRAEATATAARLAALRYQLNPHVLFNTLNAISSLIVTRCYREADDMLGKLSDFLRATLSADPEAFIPLDDELATLQHYLEIESVRFEERLAVEFVCPSELRDALVPSFVLQPLVENAIKHAVSPTDRTVTVRVEAAQDAEDLVIVVEDDGDAQKGAEPRPGTGVGLANVRQRLEVLFGARGSLETAKRERGFIAIVRLPLTRHAAELPRVA